MTIGQRIAEKRKQKGLSQETFGDIIGVSRQAVSKWESDEAIPELEKLIQMSTIFDVTVGWLINAEEEKIIEKEAPIKRKKTAPIWLCIVLVLTLILSVFIGIQATVNLKEQIIALNNSLGYIYEELSQEKANTQQAIQDALNEYTSSILNQEYEFTNFDLKNNTVDLNIKLTPKVYKEGMNVVFLINNDGEKLEASAIHQNDHSFTLVKTIKLTNNISISAQLMYTDSTELIEIGTKKGLYTSTFPVIYFLLPTSFAKRSVSVDSICQLNASIRTSNDNIPESDLSSMKVELFEDDVFVCEYTLLDGYPENYSIPQGMKITPSDDPLDGVLIEDNGNTPYRAYYFKRPANVISFDFDSHEYKEILTIVDEFGRTIKKENQQ